MTAVSTQSVSVGSQSVHVSPGFLPAHGSYAGGDDWLVQTPLALHAFSSIVSAQVVSLGAQSEHASPVFFPSHGA
jgi:hypothetical protein